MKKITSFVLLLITFTRFIPLASAQDTRFAQSLATPLSMNPALMGPNSDFKVILDYRNQWRIIEKGYNTYAFTALYPLFINTGEEKLDIGFNAYNDRAGAFTTTNLSLALGYTLKISESGNLSFALYSGYIQKSLDATSLSFDEQYISGNYNPVYPNNEPIINQKTGYPDVGFGALWYFNPADARLHAYIGTSGFHLNRPRESFIEGTANLPLKLSYQGGIKILGENKIDFTPNIRYTIQKGAEEFAIGLYTDYKTTEKTKAILGVWYRQHDAIAFSLGLEHKNFTVAYSYDAVTMLRRYVAGANAHEIMLSYKLSMSERKSLTINPSPLHPF